MAQTTPPAPDETPSATADGADAAQDSDGDGDGEAIKDSFRAALARKTSQNSHVEQHLGKRGVGAGVNDTHKRQFRRKSGG